MAKQIRPEDILKEEEIEAIRKQKIIDTICEEIAKGNSLRSILDGNKDLICRDTFYTWIGNNAAFADQYLRACEARQDKIFEECLDIANTPVEGETTTIEEDGKTKVVKGDMLQHRRLQIDTRKWMLGKMNPKKYGDRVINDNTNNNFEIELTREEREKELADLLKKAKKG